MRQTLRAFLDQYAGLCKEQILERLEQADFLPVQKAWITKLAENELLQGSGCLCRITSGGLEYCCLGVAEVFVFNRSVVGTGPIKTIVGAGGFSHQCQMSGDDARELCLFSNDGSAIGYHVTPGCDCGIFPSLAELNDGYNYTFLQIASILVSIPWRYFTNFKEPNR